MYNKLCKLSFYKHKQVANHVPKKKEYNKFFEIVIFEYKIWELVFSFVFIFDCVQFSTDSARRLFGISTWPLVSCCSVELVRSELVVRFPVLKQECTKNRTSQNFDFQYDCLIFIILFKANNPSINIIENTRRD